jgi:hypothetical protein
MAGRLVRHSALFRYLAVNLHAHVTVGDQLPRPSGCSAAAARIVTLPRRVLVLIDGDRSAVYAGRRDDGTYQYRMTRHFEAASAAHGFEHIGLHPISETHHKKTGAHFAFTTDYVSRSGLDNPRPCVG